MADVREPISDSGSRQPRSSVVERWESSVSRSRARSPPPPPPPARTLVRRGSTSTAPAPALAPPESSPASCPDSSSVARNVTVENLSAFDCSICYLPLKSPILQCPVGHVVCSTCHDKLGLRATQCHVCRAPTPGGYSRFHAMEQVVDSIRVPCPHAAHGCAERPVYHDHEAHARACAHKPCHCPGEGCGFAGPALTTLLEHFADVHGWLRSGSVGSTGGTRAGSFDVRLRKGFNVVVVTATGTTTTEDQYTLVLNVEQAAPVCNAITAFCIHPSNTDTVRLNLSYDRWCFVSGLYSSYKQDLKVVCTDLSNGLPGPGSCVPFLVPRWSGSGSGSAPGGEDEDDVDIRVTVNYIRGT